MRHRKSGRKLNRNASHRKALFRNLCLQMIEHEAINTTLPKAKELRRYFEPLVTLAKRNDTLSGRRQAFAFLGNKDSVHKLFSDLAVRSKERPGGYLKIFKNGFRTGDCAPMAYVTLTDIQEIVNLEMGADDLKVKTISKKTTTKSQEALSESLEEQVSADSQKQPADSKSAIKAKKTKEVSQASKASSDAEKQSV